MCGEISDELVDFKFEAEKNDDSMILRAVARTISHW